MLTLDSCYLSLGHFLFLMQNAYMALDLGDEISLADLHI